MSDIPQLSLQLQSTSLASRSSDSASSTTNKDRNNNNLSTLPIDILTHHLIPQFASPPVHLSRSPAVQVSPDSSALRQLASTSKHFQSLIKGQYKTYVQHQYPTVYAHAITTTVSPNLNSINWFSLAAHSEQLCRRWDLRQFYISRVPLGVQPSPSSTARQHDHINHHHNQRFNSNNNNNRDVRHSFSPCIAVSESPDGTETLVVGQGASLAVRRGEYSLWREIKRKGMTLGGADDILSVHIYNLDTILAVRSSSVEIVSNVLGKDGANDVGEDGPLRITQATDLFPSGAKNPTGGISSSCLANIASSSSSATRSFAITASTSTTAHSLQLFTLDSGLTTPTFPKAATLTSPIPSRPYTSTFLTNSTIATGHRTGLTLHHLSNASLTAVEIPHPVTTYNHALSVHSLAPLSLSPSSSSGSSNILASGWSDGVTRLLDTRSNRFVAEFENPVSNEAVPIYSLLQTAPLGNLLLAGSSLHHAVEVHDLRYAGNMHSSVITDYYNGNFNGNSNVRDLAGEGCLLFFDSLARGNIIPARNNNNNNRDRRRGGKGSTAVYSLSSASPSSGKVYIGVENGVLNMDFRKRKVGKYWGAGLSSVEKVRKKEAERNTGGGVPMYWFESVRGVGDEEGGVNGRWWCGAGKVAVKVRERR